MVPTVHERTKMLINRTCVVCRQRVPDGEGLIWWKLRCISHRGKCEDIVFEASRDRSRSRLGRTRTRHETLQIISETYNTAPERTVASPTRCGDATPLGSHEQVTNALCAT